MFRLLSIRAKLFFTVLVMIAVVVWVGYQGLSTAAKANAALSSAYEENVQPVRDLYGILNSLVLGVANSVQRMNSGQMDFVEGGSRIDFAAGEIRTHWEAYLSREQTDQSEEALDLAAELEPSMTEALDLVDELLLLLETVDAAALEEFSTTTFFPVIDETKALLALLIEEKLTQVETAYVTANDDFQRSAKYVPVTIAIGVLLSVFLSLVIARGVTQSIHRVNEKLRELASGEADLTQRIPVTSSDEMGTLSRNFNKLMSNLEELVKQAKKSGIQVTSSSTNIAAGTKQLEATVTEQTASTNNVVASAKEISATSQELVETMTRVAGLSEETATAASRGQENLSEMQETMTTIVGAAHTVSERLGAINEKAANISAVVTTINKVADQTNLLSLNAAIEAEKAGEYGRGFAVVAREIRRLADQTAVATLDIERMVKEMKGAVSSGVMGMDKFSDQIRGAVDTVTTVGAQLADIIQHVTTLNPQFESVFEGMQVQAKGAQQISDSMHQVGEAAQHTAQSLRETSEAITQLNDAAQGLQREFSRFTVG